jgi:hypothetical protein
MGTYLNRENIEYENKAFLKHEHKPERSADISHTVDLEIGEIGSAYGEGPCREAAEIMAFKLMISMAEAYVKKRDEDAAKARDLIAGGPTDFGSQLIEFD